jgi:hypothetical protein
VSSAVWDASAACLLMRQVLLLPRFATCHRASVAAIVAAEPSSPMCAAQEVAKHAQEETLAAFLDARKRFHEAGLTEQHAKQLAKLRRELAQSAKSPVEPIRQRIVEEVLTLHCPRCRQAFAVFDGCMAVTCSRAGCGVSFCGICLKDCGTSSAAHSHVSSCKYGTGSYYAAKDEVARLQKKARAGKLRALLAPLCRRWSRRRWHRCSARWPTLGWPSGSLICHESPACMKCTAARERFAEQLARLCTAYRACTSRSSAVVCYDGSGKNARLFVHNAFHRKTRTSHDNIGDARHATQALMLNFIDGMQGTS